MKLSESIKNTIDESVLCWLATADQTGQPNVSPKELFSYDHEDCIVIANIASPQSLKNLKANPLVCISFIHIFKQKGFQLKGHAEIVKHTDVRFPQKAKKLREMAGEAFTFHSLISVKIKQAKAVLAPSYVFYPDTTETEMITRAKRTYGV